MNHAKIAFLGTGKLNQALLTGLRLAQTPNPMAASVRSQESLEALIAKFPGIDATTDNALLVNNAKFVFLGVKPHAAQELLMGLRESIPDGATLISLCARLPIAKLREALGRRQISIVRLMPNTATETRSGLMGYSTERGQALPPELQMIFMSLGRMHAVDETQMDAFTILGACTPAYFLEMADAFMRAAIHEGLDETFARHALAQVLIGSGTLIQGETSPSERIRQIATPGGVTAEGLKTYSEAGLRSTSLQAFSKALGKCRSLQL